MSLPPIRQRSLSSSTRPGVDTVSHLTNDSVTSQRQRGSSNAVQSPYARSTSRASFVSPPSSVATDPSSGRPQSSGLIHAVNMNRRWAQTWHDTAEAANYYETENALMESILHDEHSMVSNTDLSRIMAPLLQPLGPDGRPAPTAILASRKPPTRFRPGVSVCDSSASVIGRREEKLGRVPTSKVNYASLLEEQKVLADGNNLKRERYEKLIADFVQKQQSLQDRFASLDL